ncbi:hypothetical protein NW754_003905 [Fusarium falciforme]|nr:hypothetical protein NW754_003905 [Fusarium falciforme]
MSAPSTSRMATSTSSSATLRTPKLIAEREARQALFGRYRNKYTDDPRVQNILKGTTANTHVIFHGNKLMALKEDARPMELGPITLETLGYVDYHGTLRCLSTRRTPSRLHHGGASLLWDETLDYQLLGVIPRRGTKPEDAKWFKTTQGCCSHTTNAYEEDGKLVLDANVWTDAHFPFFPNTKGERFFTDPRKVTAPILRYRFDPNANTDKMIHPEGVFVEGVNEFGRIDDRLLGKKYSRVWILKVDPTHQVKLNDHDAAQGNVGFNTLVCYNFDTGELQSYRHEDDTTFQEPVFVLRHEGADYEDGYILVLANRYREGRNVLLLLEASDITKGPLAEIKLQFKLMDGLHGSWVDGKEVDAAREASEARRANRHTNGK